MKNLEIIITTLKNKGYEVEERTIIKNGVEFHGLTVGKPGDTIRPNVYVSKLLEAGESVEDIIAHIERSYEEGIEGRKAINLERLQEKEYALARVKLGVQKNPEEGLAYKEYDGFVAYAFIPVEGIIKDCNASIKVSKQFMYIWGTDIDELLFYAKENTRKDYTFDSMWKIICEKMDMPVDEDEVSMGMYVISNKNNFRGASAIIDNEYLESICDKLDTDKLIILPSSVHEIIVLRAEPNMNSQDLYNMVQEVNATQVPFEEILSDNAYLFTRSGLMTL